MLIRELERQGDWLFRYRSYVPLALLPLGIIALSYHAEYLGGSPTHRAVLRDRLPADLRQRAGRARNRARPRAAAHVRPQHRRADCRPSEHAGHLLRRAPPALPRQHADDPRRAAFHQIVLLGARRHALLSAVLRTDHRPRRAVPRTASSATPFREWAARTPLLWPRFSLWQDPGYPFNCARRGQGRVLRLHRHGDGDDADGTF